MIILILLKLTINQHSDLPEPEAPLMRTDTGLLENLVSDARKSNFALLVFPAK